MSVAGLVASIVPQTLFFWAVNATKARALGPSHWPSWGEPGDGGRSLAVVSSSRLGLGPV